MPVSASEAVRCAASDNRLLPSACPWKMHSKRNPRSLIAGLADQYKIPRRRSIPCLEDSLRLRCGESLRRRGEVEKRDIAKKDLDNEEAGVYTYSRKGSSSPLCNRNLCIYSVSTCLKPSNPIKPMHTTQYLSPPPPPPS